MRGTGGMARRLHKPAAEHRDQSPLQARRNIAKGAGLAGAHNSRPRRTYLFSLI
jgi:hypothetical protein